MRRPATTLGAVVMSAALASAPGALAGPVAPLVGAPCATPGAMTVTEAGDTTLRCDGAWSPVAAPYPPGELWRSYGPPITLRGEGLRNPQVRSGAWSAQPQRPATRCRAEQREVAVIAGPSNVAAPRVTEGVAGRPVGLDVSPRLFTVVLSGDCLWQHSR